MSILSNLTKTVAKSAKRKGRGLGSGRGSKSGRGTTRHQKARTSIPLHFEGGQGRLVKKFPLLRGKSQNKSVLGEAYLIKLSQLEQIKGADVTLDSLVASGKFKGVERYHKIKVVYDKEISKAISVSLPTTKSAQAEIEKKGGKIIV